MSAPGSKPRAARRPLTFDEDGDEGAGSSGGGGGGCGGGAAEGPGAKLRRLTKDPSVRTDFLPDAERARREAAAREALKAEWAALQAAARAEKIEVTFSYWDGSGHRRALTVEKGTSVGRFLELVRDELAPSFRELSSATGRDLLFVKEDLLLPHSVTFHELIATKARGKSGPLFSFDVHDDVRLVGDARLEKDESHPGKIILRRWYEANKHIFPASRWEPWDPAKRWDTYTVHGGEVQEKKR